MLIKTGDKQKAFQAVINTWLKDPTTYCNNCGKTFDRMKDNPKCCDLPHIGKNIDHCRGVIKQNRELRRTRGNSLAATDNKNIRWGVSMPIGLLYTLDNYKKSLGMPGLFKEEGELTWFMKKFNAFSIPERI